MISFEEVIAWTAASLDRQIADALDQSELILLDQGATADEIASFRAEYTVQSQEWKAEALAEIIRGLSDWDAPTPKLQ
ncbi:hypothetical protein [Rhizobium anhuiense]|uniref:hypothetical protein n=1 Tax=Rhizobium anhuiense TaxID=1184720 RepID=UPI0007B52396|nr:hypothetical protein [Rhizobium anhuiense]KZS55266.1 hypothetical protein AS890_14745 [Rhizobium anhuiense bv. trifolii]